MKLAKIVFVTGSILSVAFPVSAQTANIIGNWQLLRQSNCLEETMQEQTDSAERMREEMKSRSPAAGRIVSFKSNSSGEESTRILNSSKVANPKKFYYKFNGDMLLILDKRSQTISDSYLVEKLTADSLILSNSARPCEMRIFVKINREPAN
jgi:hypothetical protein